jgi:hypothetical protein
MVFKRFSTSRRYLPYRDVRSPRLDVALERIDNLRCHPIGSALELGGNSRVVGGVLEVGSVPIQRPLGSPEGR